MWWLLLVIFGNGVLADRLSDYSTAVINANPLYYWPMQEISGWALHDVINSDSLTINITNAIVGVNWAEDMGKAVEFTTSAFGVSSGNILLSHMNNKVFYEFMLYDDEIATWSQLRHIVGTYENAQNRQHLYKRAGVDEYIVMINQKNTASYNRSILPRWHHIVYSIDTNADQAGAGQVSLYIDGILQSKKSIVWSTDGGNFIDQKLYLAYSPLNPSLYTNMKIAHLAIYDNLTPEQILEHATLAIDSDDGIDIPFSGDNYIPYSGKIGFIGDSLTSTNTAANQEIFLLGSGYSKVNKGVSGSTSKNWVNTYMNDTIASFISNGVKVVQIMLGTNDVTVTVGATIEATDTIDNIRTIISRLRDE